MTLAGILLRWGAMLLGLLVAGCAYPVSGVNLRSAALTPEIRDLASRADRGDKEAQFELGQRYESGRGVPRDLARAKRLYRAAAVPSGGTAYVYAPSPVPGGSGQVMPINTGASVPGNAAARERLQQIEGKAPPAPAPVQAAAPAGSGDALDQAYLDLVRIDARFAECARRLGPSSPLSEFETARQCILRPIDFDCTTLAASVAEVRALITVSPIPRILLPTEQARSRRCAKGSAPRHETIQEIVRSPVSLVNWQIALNARPDNREIPGPDVQLSPAWSYLSFICTRDGPALAESYLCAALRPGRYQSQDLRGGDADASLPVRGGGAQSAAGSGDALDAAYLDMIKLDARFSECVARPVQHSLAEFEGVRECIAAPMEYDCVPHGRSVAEVRTLINESPLVRILTLVEQRRTRRCPRLPALHHEAVEDIIRSPVAIVNWHISLNLQANSIQQPRADIQLSRPWLYLSFVCGLDQRSLAEAQLCAALRPARYQLQNRRGERNQ